MLKSQLLHPEILRVLGRSGHGARVLIADGNYPVSTASPPAAEKVFLNLMPGVPTVTEVLQALLSAIPVESAMVMVPPDGVRPPIHDKFRSLLPAGVECIGKSRQDFYEEVKSPNTALLIATGEQRRFANLLLTIGVVVEGGAL